MTYVDARQLCKGLRRRWPDFLKCHHNRSALAQLRIELPNTVLIDARPSGTLLHPAVAALVRRWGCAIRPRRRGYVYVAQCLGLTKLGLSVNPVRRVRGWQTPAAVELLCVAEVADMRACEVVLHGAFADKRRHGEWFELDEAEVAQACAMAAGHWHAS